MSRNFSHLPFRPSAWPFFYGWAVLGFGTLGVLSSVPGQTIGVSAFTDPLIAAMPITRTQLSLAYMFGTIGSSLILTYAGKLYDRFGARAVAVGASLSLGGVLLTLSQCDRIAHALHGALSTDPSWTAFAVMLAGFFALRFTGQGVLTLASRNMIMEWFERHRGLAIGISGVFVSLTFSLCPQIFDFMIVTWTWRTAWILLAMAVGVGTSVLALLFFRSRPEDCGLLPDGDPQPEEPQEDHGLTIHPTKQFTLPEARRCAAFWLFTLSISLFGLYVTGFSFHVKSIFTQAGLGRSEAFAIFLPSSIVSVLVRLTAGWLSDHLRLKYLLTVMLGGVVVSALGVVYLADGWTIWLIIGGNGVVIALSDLLMGMVWPRYFGRKHLGAISGQAMSLVVFSSALGPILFSTALDITDSYAPASWICLVAACVLLISARWANNPQTHTHPPVEPPQA